jgi:uncharacterized membrane protein
MNWLGLSAVNPWLLLGAAGIAAPIIIHLLSRRKFKVVDWAAMNFLLDADQRNRRRIRLEHLILLLLRCLAVLLIAFLVARLFITPTGLAAMLGQGARTERIVLLDDSPSTRLQSANRDVFDRAKDALAAFVRSTAAERPGDTLTLILTSRPDRPIINGKYFEQSDEMIRTIDELEAADTAATLDKALLAIEDEIEQARDAGAGALNRVVYVVSDMRQRDWAPSPDTPEDKAIGNILERLGETTDGVIVVNVGQPPEANLTITELATTEKSIVAGVPTPFVVGVKNNGLTEATDVRVTFTAGNAPPLVKRIDRIPSGGTGAATFRFTFRESGSLKVRVEVEPDAMPVDNSRLLAARVRDGIGVLLVDGDPSAEYGRTEVFYADRALRPPGETTSGNTVETVTESQFGGIDLARYQVIMIANVYQILDEQREALESWVRNGGGLIVFLGDQIDETVYNETLYRDGDGLLPARLTEVRGDETERVWSYLSALASNHPVMQLFTGQNNPFLKRVKFFQWWGAEPPADDDPNARVIASLDDSDNSPMLVEKTFGEGRVLMVTSTIDGDWTDWPADASYVVTMLETVRYLARRTTGDGNVTVGEPLVQPIDLARYRSEAKLLVPGAAEPTTVQAGSADGEPTIEDEPATEPINMAIRVDQTEHAGFYALDLQRHDGETDPVLFAANVDPTEGDLTPVNISALQSELSEANVQIVESEGYFGEGDSGGRIELWRTLAVALLLVLVAEQTLAWLFGRRR